MFPPGSKSKASTPAKALDPSPPAAASEISPSFSSAEVAGGGWVLAAGAAH